MKILLFGGAFDPPHRGHISILKNAVAYKEFDKIIVMPTGTPTHKKNCTAPFDVRMHMARAAFCGISQKVEISDWEGTNLQDDYTYRTLQHLMDEYDDAEIYMVIGSDSLFTLDKWKNAEFVMKNCTALVFAREDNIGEDMAEKAHQLKAMGAKIEFVDAEIINVSSSQFRREGEATADIINDDVQNIVEEYSLYSADENERLKGTAKLLAKILLDEKRYIHTLNVEKLAAELGTIYGLDTEKLRIAALLHDIMKNAPKDILLHRAKQSGIISKIEDKPKQTLHGFAAAHYAKTELGIDDEEILWAVKSHTCGRSGMQDIEKVIYLADMLCEERSFEGKDYLLSLAKQNLDKAMYACLAHSLEYVKSRGNTVDTDSLEAMEYFGSILSDSL